MTTKLFSEAISEVGDKYYEEAANYHCKKHGWIKWSAMAACFTVVLFTDVYKRQRIYDRLLEMCAPILFTGTNFRRQTAQSKLDKLKAMIKEKECL